MLTITLFLLATVYSALPVGIVDNNGVKECNAAGSWAKLGDHCVKFFDTDESYTGAVAACGALSSMLLSLMTAQKATEYKTYLDSDSGFGPPSKSRDRWMRGTKNGWDMGDDFIAPYTHTNWLIPVANRAAATDTTKLIVGGTGNYYWDNEPLTVNQNGISNAANTNYYACEVCLDDAKCGKDVIMMMGPHQISDDNPCPTDKVRREALKECDYCKCMDDSSGSDIEVSSLPRHSTPVASRKDCENMAKAAGKDYYNYLKLGPTVGFCSYKPADSKLTINAQTCLTDRVTINPNLKKSKPWQIYKFHNTCEACTRVLFEEQCDKCKCKSIHEVKKWPNLNGKRDAALVVADKQACADKAYAAGFTYASYREDMKWCLFSKSKSSDLECGVMTGRVTLTKAPWVILGMQCMDTA